MKGVRMRFLTSCLFSLLGELVVSVMSEEQYQQGHPLFVPACRLAASRGPVCKTSFLCALTHEKCPKPRI